MSEIKVGDSIWVEDAWEDERGNYHDEPAEVLEIQDGKMRLKFPREDVTKFLDGADFFVDDYKNNVFTDNGEGFKVAIAEIK